MLAPPRPIIAPASFNNELKKLINKKSPTFDLKRQLQINNFVQFSYKQKKLFCRARN
jgi:hypothetical protein